MPMRSAAAVSASRTWLASAVPSMFWFELTIFQIDSYEALQSTVKEKQINTECVVTDFVNHRQACIVQRYRDMA